MSYLKLKTWEWTPYYPGIKDRYPSRWKYSGIKGRYPFRWKYPGIKGRYPSRWKYPGIKGLLVWQGCYRINIFSLSCSRLFIRIFYMTATFAIRGWMAATSLSLAKLSSGSLPKFLFFNKGDFCTLPKDPFQLSFISVENALSRWEFPR